MAFRSFTPARPIRCCAPTPTHGRSVWSMESTGLAHACISPPIKVPTPSMSLPEPLRPSRAQRGRTGTSSIFLRGRFSSATLIPRMWQVTSLPTFPVPPIRAAPASTSAQSTVRRYCLNPTISASAYIARCRGNGHCRLSCTR